MDDVIFGGTGSRPMRNNAEVTLTIDNSDRGRAGSLQRIRSRLKSRGGIEARGGLGPIGINGREVRQRDVQIFFCRCVDGGRVACARAQGQISILINQKPLARRAILEEAAGISGLHQRRHEAELRLKAAEANLGRMNDIIAEVEGTTCRACGVRRGRHRAIAIYRG
jgi:chromosome segregation protein